MDNHRWSGWPGAWCLDCGISDPLEFCIANHEVKVADANGWPNWPCDACKPLCEAPCPEPGSNRYNPYVKNKNKGLQG
jgi:hypothetical protein